MTVEELERLKKNGPGTDARVRELAQRGFYRTQEYDSWEIAELMTELLRLREARPGARRGATVSEKHEYPHQFEFVRMNPTRCYLCGHPKESEVHTQPSAPEAQREGEGRGESREEFEADRFGTAGPFTCSRCGLHHDSQALCPAAVSQARTQPVVGECEICHKATLGSMVRCQEHLQSGHGSPEPAAPSLPAEPTKWKCSGCGVVRAWLEITESPWMKLALDKFATLFPAPAHADTERTT